MRTPSRHGVTLIELLVVLVLLGLVFGVSGLALASLSPPRGSEWVRQLEAARAEAIRTGRAVSVTVDTSVSGGSHTPLPTPFGSVLFLPDGRAIGPSVDPYTGAPRAVH